MKFYPCILLSRQELSDAGIPQPIFLDGKPSDHDSVRKIEDYCGRPIVSLLPSARSDNDLLALVADGYIQYNRLSGKRSVVLVGNVENLKVILSNIFAEWPDEDPYDIFRSYGYSGIDVQIQLDQWVRQLTGRE